MVVPPSGSLRVVRSNLRDRAAAIALAQEVGTPEWASSAHVLKQDERTSVLAGEANVDGVRRGVIVKVMRADRPKDSIARWTIGTRLMRQWDGGIGLLRDGISTPDCYALWRDNRGVEAMAMEKIEGRTLLYEMARVPHTIRAQHDLARETGRLTAEIIRARAYNRDHKPSNIMVRWVGEVPALSVIDTAGLRTAKRAGDTLMLSKLVIECLGIGMRPKRTLMMRALRSCGEALGWNREKRKKTWRLAAYVVKNHGDPRPAVDPLENHEL